MSGMDDFKLHERLAADTYPLGSFPLCRLLLMNDMSHPWFIMVPQRAGISEIYQLSQIDQQQLLTESSHLSRILSERFSADKLNVAALGNMVPQLHIHHIVRYRSDAAWPAPVWGHGPASPYTPEAVEAVRERLLPYLEEGFVKG